MNLNPRALESIRPQTTRGWHNSAPRRPYRPGRATSARWAASEEEPTRYGGAGWHQVDPGLKALGFQPVERTSLLKVLVSDDVNLVHPYSEGVYDVKWRVLDGDKVVDAVRRCKLDPGLKAPGFKV